MSNIDTINSKSYLRLQINEKYDKLINNIDLETEELLLKLNQTSSSHINSLIDELNQIRSHLIVKLKDILKQNLECINRLTSETEIEKNFQKECKVDCVYFENKLFENLCANSAGVLLVTDYFISDDEEKLLRDVVSCFTSSTPINRIIPIEKILIVDKILQNKFINQSYVNVRSNEFANIKTVKMVSNPVNCIFEPNKIIFDELFNLDELIVKKTNQSISRCYHTKLKYLRFSTFSKSIQINSLNYKHLKLLDLSHNLIKKLEIDCFSGLLSLEKLIISKNEIEIIEKGTFSNLNQLEFIDLSSNHIKQLDNDLFKDCKSLRVLNLTSNPLQKVESDWLRGDLKLHTLNITFKYGFSFSKDAFKDLKNLKNLKLSFSSPVNKLPESLFEHFVQLEEMHLRRASFEINLPLNKIPENLKSIKKLNIVLKDLRYVRTIFEELKQLEELIVEWERRSYVFDSSLKLRNFFAFTRNEEKLINRADDLGKIFGIKCDKYADDNSIIDLSKIKSIFIDDIRIGKDVLSALDSFKENNFSLSNLERLIIYSKNIEVSNQCSFEKLPNLKTLELRRIDNLNGNCFINLNKLENLDLSYNRLDIIRNDSFNGLASLKRLNLRGNNIERIDEGAFNGLISLTLLNLSKNKLKMFDLNWIKNIPTKLVDLTDNHKDLIDFLEKPENIQTLKYLFLTKELVINIFNDCRMYRYGLSYGIDLFSNNSLKYE